MRVATSLVPDVLAGINQSEAAMQTALQEVSTGQRVNVPSDDPTAAAAMVENQAQTDNVDQYEANGNAALGTAQTADSAISSVVSLLTQAISLGTEGANGTESASSRQSLAAQIQGTLSSVVSDANTQYQGVAVFGGTSNAPTAFIADSSSSTGYTYQGDEGISTVQVGQSLDVQINVPGDQLFDNPSASVLGSLSQLAGALESGSTSAIGTATGAVSSALNYLSSQHVVYADPVDQLNAQETFLAQDKVTLSTQASNLVDVDAATAAEDLASAEAQNSAVLAAAAKVLPTTLLDYLK